MEAISDLLTPALELAAVSPGFQDCRMLAACRTPLRRLLLMPGSGPAPEGDTASLQDERRSCKGPGSLEMRSSSGGAKKAAMPGKTKLRGSTRGMEVVVVLKHAYQQLPGTSSWTTRLH